MDRVIEALVSLGAIHWLQEEVLELEVFEAFRWRACLREYELQFVARPQDEFVLPFGANADPIDAFWGRTRAIGLDPDFKTVSMKCIYQRRIDLQQRFTTCEHNIATLIRASPFISDCLCQQFRVRETAPTGPIHTHEVGVAKGALRARAVLFATRPKIAARETAENSRAPSMSAFTLQGLEYLFDRISHGYSAASSKSGAGAARRFCLRSALRMPMR